MSTTAPGPTNGTRTAANGADGTARVSRPRTAAPSGIAVQPAPFRPQRRGRNGLIAVVLMGLGALGAYFGVHAAVTTTSVIEVRDSVTRGQVITREDLSTVDVSAAGVKTVPASRLGELIGQRATQTLYAGTLLSPDALSVSVVPATGQSLVGVALTSAQMPTEPLVEGDVVSIVDTPDSSDATSAVPDAPNATEATVQNVGTPDSQGLTTVDVLVPTDEAAQLAAQASTGRVALVLQTRER